MSDLNPYEEGLAIDLATAQARIEELEAKLQSVKSFLGMYHLHSDADCRVLIRKALVELSRVNCANTTGGEDD